MAIIVGRKVAKPLEIKKRGKAEYITAGTETPVGEVIEPEDGAVEDVNLQGGEETAPETAKSAAKKPGRKKKGGRK